MCFFQYGRDGGLNIFRFLFYRFNNNVRVPLRYAIQWTTDLLPFFIRNVYACEKPELKSLLSTGRIFNIVLSYFVDSKLQK